MRSYEVVGQPLTVNGVEQAVGEIVEMHPEDADVLAELGHLKPARKGKAATQPQGSEAGE